MRIEVRVEGVPPLAVVPSPSGIRLGLPQLLNVERFNSRAPLAVLAVAPVSGKGPSTALLARATASSQRREVIVTVTAIVLVVAPAAWGTAASTPRARLIPASVRVSVAIILISATNVAPSSSSTVTGFIRTTARAHTSARRC